MIKNRICEYCKKEYDASYKEQIFCSRSCASFFKGKNRKKNGRKQHKKECLFCEKEFFTVDKRRKYCSKSCAAKTNKAAREPRTEEQKRKMNEGLKRFWRDSAKRKLYSEKMAKSVSKYTRGKYREYPPESILELSKRTVGKVFKRLKIGCSLCGWDECACDIHHIKGKKIEDPDNHRNLTYLCPNCHRKAHNNIIEKEDLINLKDYIGDTWKDFYYG